eukprot:766987-Hanusia_phi.AAC.4
MESGSRGSWAGWTRWQGEAGERNEERVEEGGARSNMSKRNIVRKKMARRMRTMMMMMEVVTTMALIWWKRRRWQWWRRREHFVLHPDGHRLHVEGSEEISESKSAEGYLRGSSARTRAKQDEHPSSEEHGQEEAKARRRTDSGMGGQATLGK